MKIFGLLFSFVLIASGCGNMNSNCPAGTMFVNGTCQSTLMMQNQMGTNWNNGWNNTGWNNTGWNNGWNQGWNNGWNNQCGAGRVMRPIWMNGFSQWQCLPICPQNPQLGLWGNQCV